MKTAPLKPHGYLVDLGFWLALFAVVLGLFDWHIGLACAVAAVVALTTYRLINRRRHP